MTHKRTFNCIECGRELTVDDDQLCGKCKDDDAIHESTRALLRETEPYIMTAFDHM